MLQSVPGVVLAALFSLSEITGLTARGNGQVTLRSVRFRIASVFVSVVQTISHLRAVSPSPSVAVFNNTRYFYHTKPHWPQ